MRKILRRVLSAFFAACLLCGGAVLAEGFRSVTLGRCEQDGDPSNGPEPIEWLVLEEREGRALLLSRYGLDARPFHARREEAGWAECTLRAWLNGEFFSSAFTADEQGAILAADLSGNGARERVFLLSREEARRLLADDEARICAPTEYALRQGAYTSGTYKADGKAACWWWLRSAGPDARHAAAVTIGGTEGSGSLRDSSVAVRPALWVDGSALLREEPAF